MKSAFIVSADKAFQSQLRQTLEERLGYRIIRTFETLEECATHVNVEPEEQAAYVIDSLMGGSAVLNPDALVDLVESVLSRSCAVSIQPEVIGLLRDKLEKAWEPIRKLELEPAE